MRYLAKLGEFSANFREFYTIIEISFTELEKFSAKFEDFSYIPRGKLFITRRSPKDDGQEENPRSRAKEKENKSHPL